MARSRPLKALFDLRPGEIVPTLLMSGYFFLVITCFWILKPIKKSLFLEFHRPGLTTTFGGTLLSFTAAEMELAAKVLNMIVAALAAVAFVWIARHCRRQRLTYVFGGCSLLAFALFTRFEAKLEQFSGNLGRSAVELAKDWRTDKLLRQLQALLIVADGKQMFVLSGDGDVIEPDGVADGIIATIGSGGSFALAAATALLENTQLSAREIVERSMKIAADICIYSNQSVVIEEIGAAEQEA